jgi:hypothetical protein
MNTLMHTSICSAVGVAFLALGTSCSQPNPESFIPKIQQEGQAFVDAMNRMDEETTAAMMPAEFLKEINGEVWSYISMRRQGVQKSNFKIVSATVGIPPTPEIADDFMVAFVPVRTVLAYDDGGDIGKMRLFGPTSATVTTHLVATSSNKGRDWRFFESTEDRSLIDKLLPGTVGKIIIPDPLVDIRAH